MVWLAALLVLAFPQASSAPVVWGGDHVALTERTGGPTVEFDCATGALDASIRTDAQGAFRVNGTVVAEHAGPTRRGEEPRPMRAVYSGTIIQDAMTLVVVVDGQDPAGTTYHLTRGQPGNLRKCR